MKQNITKHTHEYTDHVTIKIPQFCRAIVEKQILQYFNTSADKRGNHYNLKNGEDAKAVIMLIPYFAKKQQYGKNVKKTKMN